MGYERITVNGTGYMKQISSLDKDGYSWINLGYHSWISSGICFLDIELG